MDIFHYLEILWCNCSADDICLARTTKIQFFTDLKLWLGYSKNSRSALEDSSLINIKKWHEFYEGNCVFFPSALKVLEAKVGPRKLCVVWFLLCQSPYLYRNSSFNFTLTKYPSKKLQSEMILCTNIFKLKEEWLFAASKLILLQVLKYEAFAVQAFHAWISLHLIRFKMKFYLVQQYWAPE